MLFNYRIGVGPANASTHPVILFTLATAASVLPWKREDSDVQLSAVAMQQREFPAWINNKDYVNYSSPSNTLLGKSVAISQLTGAARSFTF